MKLAVQIALLIVAVLAATGVAELLGAVNLGIALTFGQIAFVALLAFFVLRR